MNERIYGYTDRPNVRPGEKLDFFISCSEPGPFDARLIRLERRIEGDADGQIARQTVPGIAFDAIDGIPQHTQVGGFIVVPDPDARLAGTGGFTVHLFCWPTTPAKAQTLAGRWHDGAGWRIGIEESHLVFELGNGQATKRVALTHPLLPEIWYSVVASYDAVTGQMRLSQQSVINSANSRFSPILGYDGAAETSGQADGISTASAPLVIAGSWLGQPDPAWHVGDCFNGKIEAPRFLAGAQNHGSIHAGAGRRLLAHWDFAHEIGPQGVPTDRISDVSGGGLNGFCINQPDRAMTGRLWQGIEECFRHAPDQYGAIWFHDDSLDDCRWQPTITITIPEDLASGAYALALSKGGLRDYIPFFVVPPRGETGAKTALLIPTYRYLAYANTQVMQNGAVAQAVMGVLTTLDQRDLDLNRFREYGLSTYDYHADGRGVQYSSWRRPILNMRPDYRHEFGSVWQFPADLDLIEWLEHEGIAYDIITDHDLEMEGADILHRYKAVICPSHPEYYSRGMMDSWEEYLSEGGGGLYLGGNGYYWIASPHPEKPWMIEVRKGESGDQAWRARPGELYHGTSGERGGLWRNRARAPQKLWGIGYAAHGLDMSAPYYQMPDARAQDNGWIMEGIAPDEPIGDSGTVNGGASGLEMDRIDYALGTPPNAQLLASSFGHSGNAMLPPEEQYFSYPGMNGREHPLVRADIVYFDTAKGGGVFSTGSMAWCGSLMSDEGNNNVSRLTANILRHFANRPDRQG